MSDSGYSGTPQLKKLGIGLSTTWDLDNTGEGWTFEIPPEPTLRVTTGPVDVIIAFVRAASEIVPLYDRSESRIFPAGALWVAWPRKAAGHHSDVDENLIRAAALERHLVDVKVAAIDRDWSGLKIVWRKEHRGAAPTAAR